MSDTTIHIFADTTRVVRAFREAEGLLLDLMMRLHYSDDLADPECEVFV